MPDIPKPIVLSLLAEESINGSIDGSIDGFIDGSLEGLDFCNGFLDEGWSPFSCLLVTSLSALSGEVFSKLLGDS